MNSEWQPIETAPKDGRLVLMSDGVQPPIAGAFRHGHWVFLEELCWSESGGRCVAVIDYWVMPDAVPDLWMPLRKPPCAKKREGIASEV